MYIPLNIAANTSTTMEFPAKRYYVVLDPVIFIMRSMDSSSIPIRRKHSRGVIYLKGMSQLNYAPPQVSYCRRNAINTIDTLHSFVTEIFDQSCYNYANFPLAF